MYHLELRQFPHNLNRFNLDDRALWVILEPWAREKAVELGERKWSPHQAKLTVLEGPHLSVQELSLGRGWRAAQRRSEDVTDRVLARATEAVSDPPSAPQQTPPQPSADGDGPAADPLALAVELAALLGQDPARLLSAWRAIAARAPGLSPSESLALAERETLSPEPADGR
jgi:hypothetical protein